jgi:hypothetical protein
MNLELVWVKLAFLLDGKLTRPPAKRPSAKLNDRKGLRSDSRADRRGKEVQFPVGVRARNTPLSSKNPLKT